MERWLDLRSAVLEGGLLKISSYSRKRLYQATGLWFGRPGYRLPSWGPYPLLDLLLEGCSLMKKQTGSGVLPMGTES